MQVFLASHYDSKRLTPRRARVDDPLEQCFELSESDFQAFFVFCVDIDAWFLPE